MEHSGNFASRQAAHEAWLAVSIRMKRWHRSKL